MSKLPAAVLAVLSIGFTTGYFACEAFRTWLEANPTLLDGWNGIAALSVFVFLYYTLRQFNLSQSDREEQESALLAQRLSALLLEIEMNIGVCDEILGAREEYLNARSVPLNHIHGDMLCHFATEGLLDEVTLERLIPQRIKAGDVTSRRMGVTLINAYHYLLQGNDIIDRGVTIMTLQALSQEDRRVDQRTNERLKHYMQGLVETAEKLRASLTTIRPILQEMEQSARR